MLHQIISVDFFNCCINDFTLNKTLIYKKDFALSIGHFNSGIANDAIYFNIINVFINLN